MTTETVSPLPLRNGVPRVLVVDDEPDLRELLELTVLKMGLDVESAATVAEARERLARHAFSLCLTDMRLPDGDGIELVRLVGERFPNTLIAVITAYGSADAAVAALKAGAFDFLSKPVALEQLRMTIQSALKARDSAPSRRTSTPPPSADVERIVLGVSEAINNVRASIARLARSMAPVLIHGESGTGKEVAARAIHAASARSDRPFVAVNCGAIPETLMEAEFFGYRKGAFTGADADRDGFFQAAHGGTLMLDEIAELPLAMQVKLLRAIQERRVRKVGSTQEEPVDVRIVSATHRNLGERVSTGLFRQDLFYRLNVIELHMPPLRDRPEDIPVLAHAILARIASIEGRSAKRHLTSEALEALQAHPFPGNVRELENLLERACAFASTEAISAGDLGLETVPVQAMQRLKTLEELASEEEASAISSPPMRDSASAPIRVRGIQAYLDEIEFPMSMPEQLEALERELIERALQQTKFNRTAAAKLLGVTFRQLRYRIQQLGVK